MMDDIPDFPDDIQGPVLDGALNIIAREKTNVFNAINWRSSRNRREGNCLRFKKNTVDSKVGILPYAVYVTTQTLNTHWSAREGKL